jgi:hypothetical protein
LGDIVTVSAGQGHCQGCSVPIGDQVLLAARADTLDQQPPAVNGQPGITVGHEDLRAVQS